MQFFVQDPLEVIEYQINWTDVLGVDDDGLPLKSITASAWNAPAPVLLENPVIDGTYAAVRVSGVEIGEKYQVSNNVTLSNGEEYAEGIIIYCENK